MTERACRAAQKRAPMLQYTSERHLRDFGRHIVGMVAWLARSSSVGLKKTADGGHVQAKERHASSWRRSTWRCRDVAHRRHPEPAL